MIMQNTITRHNTSLDHDTAIMEHYRQEQPWGLATSIDLQGCNPSLIRSAEHICAFVDALCICIDMKKFGPTIVVDFGEDPRVSGFSINQSNAAYIDIFSCKAYHPSVAATFAREFFQAQEMRVSINFRY
jgi:hypothetical protein